MPASIHNISMIQQQSELDAALLFLPEPGILSMDTEFMRTNTYASILCLIQISAGDRVFCIDTLADLDIGDLWPILMAESNVIIMHACRQDLEILHLNHHCLPQPLFDTQIAAGLLGHPAQIGYAGLVHDILGIHVDKGQTRTDWSRRPLSEAQISYAANDTVHLADLYNHLREKLEQHGRYEWVVEDCAALADPALHESPPELAWQRIKSIPFLPPAEQARARKLAQWREQKAARADRPRQWILSDKALLSIALDNPQTVGGLADCTDVAKRFAERHAENIIKLQLAATCAWEKGELTIRQHDKPAAEEKAAVKRMSEITREIAAALNIVPEVLAAKKELIAIFRGEQDGRVLNGWRKEVIGEKLLGAL